jgi:hypothetical protein
MMSQLGSKKISLNLSLRQQGKSDGDVGATHCSPARTSIIRTASVAVTDNTLFTADQATNGCTRARYLLNNFPSTVRWKLQRGEPPASHPSTTALIPAALLGLAWPEWEAQGAAVHVHALNVQAPASSDDAREF